MPLHSPKSANQNGHRMVALLITPLERLLLLSSCSPIIPPVLRCLWVIWLQGLQSRFASLVPTPVAPVMVCCEHLREGTCPVVAAAAIWGPHCSGSHMLFHCDNKAVVTVLQNWNAHETTLLQLLRCLFFYSARFQFHFSATHIPGVHNVVADAISRNSFNLLSSLIPQAQQIRVPVSVAAFLLSPLDWGL